MNNSGEKWYTEDIGKHDAILTKMRPELADPAKMSMFKSVEAVLSSGQKPYRNFTAAMQAWDVYNKTGKFPPINPETGKSWGPRGAASYGKAIDNINRLISERGEQGASDWLLSQHPVSELRQYNEGVSGKKDDPALGAMILGPKRGPFGMNLHGKEAEFTADMWVSRSWNRWMGTMEFGKEGGTGDETILSGSPRNQRERGLMKQSFQETADKLGKTTSALQAILWYYEQGLYTAHGVPKESWSFSAAADRASKEESERNQTDLFGRSEGESRKAGGGGGDAQAGGAAGRGGGNPKEVQVANSGGAKGKGLSKENQAAAQGWLSMMKSNREAENK
jgi:hypothetical protein